jgi:hypothetical protein
MTVRVSALALALALALAASMTIRVESLGLRSPAAIDDESSANDGGERSETDAIAVIVDDGRDRRDERRDLFLTECKPEITPLLWHPDYSKSWSVSGCVYKKDCDSPGWDTEAACCAGAYGGQTNGACTSINAGTSGSGASRWYPDYDTPWPMAGCVNALPLPIHATIFFDAQLDCCNGAFAGQMSGACISKLVSPPTSKPTTIGEAGGGWYADYGTAWLIAGCKNSLPRPIYTIVVYDTELECCRAAYGGQSTDACVQGLPNPPTKKPTSAPTRKPTRSPSKAPTKKPTASPTKAPTGTPTWAPTSAPVCPVVGGKPVGGACSRGSDCCSGNCASNVCT